MRLISLCLAFCLVFCSVIPASAAEEYTYTLTYNDELQAFFCPVADFPFVAGSSAVVSIVTNLPVSFEPSSILFVDMDDDFIGFSLLPSDYNLMFYFIYSPSFSGVAFNNADGFINADDDSYFKITFTSDSLDAYINPITDAIPIVLGWFGLMLTGITSGKISVLWSICCVGIAIAVIFVVIKIIKRFSWGA